MEKRCKNCKRLLFVDNGTQKIIKTTDKIIYKISGTIEIQCKCGTKNQF